MIDPLLELAIHNTPATLSNSDLAYVERGHGHLVVLVHGSLCDMRYWRWQVNLLYPHAQVLCLSLPGYWPYESLYMAYDFSLEQHVQAIADVVAAVQQPSQKLIVVGHSRGAQVATQYALEHVVDGLVLADPAFGSPSHSQPLAIIDQAASLVAAGNESEGLALFIDTVSGSNTWRHMVGWFKTMVTDNAHTLIAQSREQLPTFSPIQLQSLHALPILLIGGEHSPARYKTSLQALSTLWPNAINCQIAGASHGMNLAKPKRFNAAIQQFLTDYF